MKSAAEIFVELGFKIDGPESVKKAFFSHLAQASGLPMPDLGLVQKKPNEPKEIGRPGDQLCFVIEDSPEPIKPKAS